MAIVVGLVAPQAARAQAPPPAPCVHFDLEEPRQSLRGAAMVVVGEVVEADESERAVVMPEAYLKGATSPDELVLDYPESLDAYDCEPSAMPGDGRVMLILGRDGGHLAWPGEGQVFHLAGGEAVLIDDDSTRISEDELIDRVRGATGQYSLPPGAGEDSARLDWFGTVLPVTAATLVVFAIGLVLMREWHRIDPS